MIEFSRLASSYSASNSAISEIKKTGVSPELKCSTSC